MKEVKLKSRTFENTLELLRDYWEENKTKQHLSLSVLLLSQMVGKPGITSNLHLPALIKFIDRNGIYGVDGIFLSAMSCAQSFKGDKSIVKDAFAIGKSIKRKKQNDFKAPLFITFFDFLGSSISTFDSSIIERVPNNIRGRNISSATDPSKPIPEYIERSGINSNVYEYNRNSSLSDLYDQTKFHNVMSSFFPDINRDKIFEEFGSNIHEREGEILNFGKAIRKSGSQHHNRPELGDRNRSWYMSDADDEWWDDVFKTSIALGSAGISAKIRKGQTGATNQSIVAYGFGGLSVGRLIGDVAQHGRKFAETNLTESFTAIGKVVKNVITNLDSDSETTVEITIEYVVHPDDSSDSGSDSSDSGSDSSEDTMDFTNEGIGEDDNPDNEHKYPIPESNPNPNIPEEIIGKILGDILNGNVNPHIVYPNPESIGGRERLTMIKDIRIDKRDHYIYPNPNGNPKKYYLIEEENLRNVVRGDLINPGDPQDV